MILFNIQNWVFSLQASSENVPLNKNFQRTITVLKPCEVTKL